MRRIAQGHPPYAGSPQSDSRSDVTSKKDIWRKALRFGRKLETPLRSFSALRKLRNAIVVCYLSHHPTVDAFYLP
jgi:hypothetical protein